MYNVSEGVEEDSFLKSFVFFGHKALTACPGTKVSFEFPLASPI